MRPSCARTLPSKTEGAGKAGCPLHPQPRVQSKKHTSVVATGSDGFNRLSPRDGFNGFLRALPGDRALLPPSLADIAANLTPASGRQDHTSSPSASSTIRQARQRVHRIPYPTSVTIAIHPSLGSEWRGI